jgi:hypothetical protein
VANVGHLTEIDPLRSSATGGFAASKPQLVRADLLRVSLATYLNCVISNVITYLKAVLDACTSIRLAGRNPTSLSSVEYQKVTLLFEVQSRIVCIQVALR